MESTQHQTPNLAGLLVRIAVFDMEAFFLHPNDDASTASLLESPHDSHNGSALIA